MFFNKMKKVILMFAAAMLTMSASAQRTAVTANKAQDNWYVGINAGIRMMLRVQVSSRASLLSSVFVLVRT